MQVLANGGYEPVMSRTKDLNDEAIAIVLRVKSIPQKYREFLATKYIRAKYFGDRKELDNDDLHRLVILVDKFLNRIESGEL